VVTLNNLAWIHSEHGGEPPKDKALALAQMAKQVARGVYQRALALPREGAVRLPDNAELQYHLGLRGPSCSARPPGGCNWLRRAAFGAGGGRGVNARSGYAQPRAGLVHHPSQAGSKVNLAPAGPWRDRDRGPARSCPSVLITPRGPSSAVAPRSCPVGSIA